MGKSTCGAGVPLKWGLFFFFVSDPLWCIFHVCKLVSKSTSERYVTDFIYLFNACIFVAIAATDRKLVNVVKRAECAVKQVSN